jgi:hypothetical protein
MKTKISATNNIKNDINWAIPNQSVTHTAFSNAITDAEKSTFISIEEFEKKFETWKHKKNL